jgi:hypothetical protein
VCEYIENLLASKIIIIRNCFEEHSLASHVAPMAIYPYIDFFRDNASLGRAFVFYV